MYVIRARNVNDAYAFGVPFLESHGTRQESRYGTVIKVDEPVTTLYERPCERVLFDAGRDANPFFHLFESLWILGGRNDVKFLARFVKRMAEFSDDGVRYHAPYGERLRHYEVETPSDYNNGFGVVVDQLAIIIEKLKTNPSDRRLVATIWSPGLDLPGESKDIPCNDLLKFSVGADGRLDLQVFCRSNDIVWGAYGANAVQFSMILEYVAGMAGLAVGRYWQISADYHGYTNVLEKLPPTTGAFTDPYHEGQVEPFPLVTVPEKFDRDLHTFLRFVDEDLSLEDLDERSTEGLYDNEFFWKVAEPMYYAWRRRKNGDLMVAAYVLTTTCWAQDWRRAGMEWIERRGDK